MFAGLTLRSGRPPPVPEASPESAAARKKQEEDKKEESPPLANRPIPVTSEASSSQSPQATATEDLGRDKETRSVSAEGQLYVPMAPDLIREKLCIKAGEMTWNDLSQVMIWPMLDIEHSDEAMVERVKDLLGPDISGEEVFLGEPFIAEYAYGMAIVDYDALCGILVTTESRPGIIRVADMANLKPQTAGYAVGYGEFDVENEKLFGPHVMIVKYGQTAVIQGRPTLRFFVRVDPSTPKQIAELVAQDAWLYRTTVPNMEGAVWHDHFTKKGT